MLAVMLLNSRRSGNVLRLTKTTNATNTGRNTILVEPCPIDVKFRPWLSAENLVLVLTEILHLTPDHGPKPRWLACACKNGMQRKCDTA